MLQDCRWCLKMKFVFLIILQLILIIARSHKIHMKAMRIVGGRTVSINSYPFIGAIVYKTAYNSFNFAGACTIISSSWTVTAAHCVYDFREEIEEGRLYVRSNSTIWTNSTTKDSVEHQIIRAYVHDRYDNVTDDYDIALVKIKGDFFAINEQVVPYADESFQLQDGTYGTVLGWGTTTVETEAFMVATLRAAHVQIIGVNECVASYSDTSEIITARMVCAGAPGKDACINDSGGPLIQNRTLIGIVSWGLECASSRHPGVYTRISPLANWIKKTQMEGNYKQSSLSLE